MKYYLVSEEQLKDLCDTADWETRARTSTSSYTSHESAKKWLIKTQEDCRKIELPADTIEQLETFRKLKQHERTRWMGMGDYFKHRND